MNSVTNTNIAPLPLHNKHDGTSPCRPCLTLSAPHAIFKQFSKKIEIRFEQVKYNTIYAFGENNKSGIRSRQVPVWRGLISIVLSVSTGFRFVQGPVCTGCTVQEYYLNQWKYTFVA